MLALYVPRDARGNGVKQRILATSSSSFHRSSAKHCWESVTEEARQLQTEINHLDSRLVFILNWAHCLLQTQSMRGDPLRKSLDTGMGYLKQEEEGCKKLGTHYTHQMHRTKKWIRVM